MTSSRLPGKVLLPAAGQPMLAHLVGRLRAVPSLATIVVATTDRSTDDPVVAACEALGVRVVRGSEHDVLQRVLDAAVDAGADIVVETTADCPILDPDIVEQVIRMYLHHGVDYASNTVVRSYPDGMDVQVFATELLARTANLTEDPDDREHVSRFIWRHPDRFSQIQLIAPPSLHWPELGLTLDEASDYALLRTIIGDLGGDDLLFGCREVVEYLRRRPDLVALNRAVVRRTCA